MINDIKKEAEQKMQRGVEALKEEMRRLRTGRAHAGLLEHVMVEYYGTNVPVKQTANISVEDARTLVVTPWEKQMVGPVEKAILNSGLGLNPVTAGIVIRVHFSRCPRVGDIDNPQPIPACRQVSMVPGNCDAG